MPDSRVSPSLLDVVASPSSAYSFSSNDRPAQHRALVASDALELCEEELEPTGSIRMISATVGALITSFVVTPFDVVKTRLQAQLHLLTPSNSGFQSQQSAVATHSSPFASAPSSSAASLLSHPQAQSSSLRPLAVSASAVRTPHQSTRAMLDSCTHTPLQTGLMDIWAHRGVIQPPRHASVALSRSFAVPPPPATAAAAETMHFTGTLDALTKLVRYEGIGSLWRGLSPQLLLSIPSTVVYFWAYDELKHGLQAVTAAPHPAGALSTVNPYLSMLSPLLAGTSARALTTVLVSPIELIRTRTQSLSTSPSMLDLARAEVEKGGWRSLWRGANPTLWRDVPFSAFYWTSYEFIKARMMRVNRRRLDAERRRGSDVTRAYEGALLWTSFVSGASSGMIAAFFTHPFDLVKTRRQIEMYNLAPAAAHAEEAAGGAQDAAANSARSLKGRTATFEMLRVIVREEGWVGLSTGMLARMSKIVPACAIMISVYEAAKHRFTRPPHH